MRVVVLFLAAAFFAVSCSSCSAVNSNLKNEHITSVAYVEQCTSPSEAYDVPPLRFPMHARVVRHQNCLGVDDLLVVSWPGELSPKNKAAAQLLMFMYLEFRSDEFEAELLKTDVNKQGGHMIGSAFYKLTKKVEEKLE